jgi:hypothetical protein
MEIFLVQDEVVHEDGWLAGYLETARVSTAVRKTGRSVCSVFLVCISRAYILTLSKCHSCSCVIAAAL